jgi:hypothetical protein
VRRSRGPRNGRLLVGAVALTLVVVACTSDPVPPPISLAVAACQPDDTDLPAPYPEMSVVAAAEDQGAGAALLTAPVPGDPLLAYLQMCAYMIGGQGEAIVTGMGITAVDAVLPGPVAVESRLAVEGDRPQAGIGGRVSEEVARVEVVLSDGSRSDVPIRDGYFLSWWGGAGVDAISLVAYDAAGTKIGEVEDETGIVRHELPGN